MLKGYDDGPYMHTLNTDVPNAKANGTRAKMKSVRMKPGEHPFPLLLDNGTTIWAAFASQVDSIEMEHENDDITPRLFEVKSEIFRFKCKIIDDELGDSQVLQMKGRQFPLISNTATTGHKLQGCTVDNIYINDWWYKQNWAYVVLSRVTTSNGLFLKEKMSKDLKKYTKPREMRTMLDDLEKKVVCKQFSSQEYEQMKISTQNTSLRIDTNIASDVDGLDEEADQSGLAM